MALLAYNKTTSDVVIPSPYNPSLVLPASLDAGVRSEPAVDLTIQFRGLSSANLALINTQLVLTNKVDFEWTNGTPQYSTPGLTTTTIGPVVSYTNLTRPAASAVGANPDHRVEIWNTNDNSPNYSNGTNWYDTEGNIT